MSSAWKKVVLRGDNATDEQLTVTEAAIDLANDFIVFADDDDSEYLKREGVGDFVGAIAGTNTATGLTESSGVLSLDTGVGAISTLAPDNDLVMVYDADGVWGTATVGEIGSAGTDTNSEYTITVADTDDDTSTITLAGSGDADGTDVDVVINTSGELTINSTAEGNIIDLGTTTTPTSFTKITNTSLELGRDDDNVIDFGTADNQIDFKVNGAVQILLKDGSFAPKADADVDLGTSDERWNHVYTDELTVTNEITGSISGNAGGNAATATAVDTTVTDNDSEFAILMTGTTDGGNVTPELTTEVTINASTNKITAAGFIGALEGNADSATSATDATNAANVAISDQNGTSEAQYFVFAEGTSGNQALGVDSTFYYTPNTDTLTVTNLVVSGTETKVNTTDLSVTDLVIELAAGSPDAGTASGAGIQINIDEEPFDQAANGGDGNQTDVDASFAKMPTLTWNSGGTLSGWEVQNYNAATAASKFPIAIMANGSGAPPSTGSLIDDIGDGAFYLDDTNSQLYVRV